MPILHTHTHTHVTHVTRACLGLAKLVDVLHGDSLCDIKPKAQPVDAEAMARDHAVDRLNPQLGHNLVQPAVGRDLLLRQQQLDLRVRTVTNSACASVLTGKLRWPRRPVEVQGRCHGRGGHCRWRESRAVQPGCLVEAAEVDGRPWLKNKQAYHRHRTGLTYTYLPYLPITSPWPYVPTSPT